MTFLHQFSENREKQRKTYERKKKFSAAINKDKLIWVFHCGKKELPLLYVKERMFWHYFAIVSVKLSISLLLKERNLKFIMMLSFSDQSWWWQYYIFFILVMCSISAQRWYRIESKGKLYILILTNIKLRYTILPK